MFAAHWVQLCDPVAGLYVPAAQMVHVPPSGPVYPALHTHWEMEVLPAGECELEGHVTHEASAVAPVVERYLPAPHRVHDALPAAAL